MNYEGQKNIIHLIISKHNTNRTHSFLVSSWSEVVAFSEPASWGHETCANRVVFQRFSAFYLDYGYVNLTDQFLQDGPQWKVHGLRRMPWVRKVLSDLQEHPGFLRVLLSHRVPHERPHPGVRGLQRASRSALLYQDWGMNTLRLVRTLLENSIRFIAR